MPKHQYVKEVKTYFVSPIISSLVNIPSIRDTVVMQDDGIGQKYFLYEKTSTDSSSLQDNEITVTSPSGQTTVVAKGLDASASYQFSQNGIYIIRYKCVVCWYTSSTEQNYPENFTFSFSIAVVPNYLPLKKHTVTDVIKRLCDVAEPIYIGEHPRFRLQGVNADGSIRQGSLADRLDKIISPSYTFTKQTLRECLQQIGAFIHGEPRLIPVKDESGEYIFEIVFDEYGGTSMSEIAGRHSVKSDVKHSIEQFGSAVDSSVENLVNQLDKFSGVISEPSAEGYSTVRTESVYARVQEDNMYIPTTQRIYTVEDIEVGLIPNKNGAQVGYVSIMPYLFEKTHYDAYLSSYTDVYPNSKAYGIYFTQGEKGIHGLSFKAPGEYASGAFKNYAILNILRKVTEVADLDLNGDHYPQLAFRVTYTPFYNSRVAQSKVHYKETPRASTLVYNQGANIVESKYYGENLKGAIARLGNVERTETYIIGNIEMIPKAGDLYDEDYYISAVLAEDYPTFTKVTIGLSKDFNKLSEYIGINSTKRYSEVSTTQAVERNMLFREYVVIGERENEATDNEPTFIRDSFVERLTDIFNDYVDDIKPISNVISTTLHSDGNEVKISLPVISSAFGNSVCFSWQYEDNYSAGSNSQHMEVGSNEEKVSGYFQNNIPYCDYYGRVKGFAFNLGYGNVQDQSTVDKQTEVGGKLPLFDGTETAGVLQTPQGKYFNIRKDSREILQVNVQVDLVSNDNNLIIGSALAAYCPLVRGTETYTEAWSDVKINKYRPRLYVFDKPLEKFVNHLNSSTSGNVLPDESDGQEVYIRKDASGVYLTANAFIKNGKSWAIVTRQTVEETEVEDEDGNPSTERIEHGGDVLLAENMDISAGQAFKPIYFTPKREVFDKSCWVDKI